MIKTWMRKHILSVLGMMLVMLGISLMPLAQTEANSTTRFIGMYVDGFPGWPRQWGLLDQIRDQVGRYPQVVMYFTDWEHDRYNTDVVNYLHERGLVPMIAWLPSGSNPLNYTMDTINAGQHDAYLREYARSVRNLGKPIFIRFAHEMNGVWYPWGMQNGNTPEKYVAAWRRIHDIFTQEGANPYVRWVWAPNVEAGAAWTPAPLEQFYPGDAYVDWVAMVGYNWGHSPGWWSFEQIFGATYNRLVALTSRPIMIAETASADNDGGLILNQDKGAWIRDAFFHEIPTNFPRIQGVIWFNQNKERHWTVNSSESALNAFREVFAAPMWQGSQESMGLTHGVVLQPASPQRPTSTPLPTSTPVPPTPTPLPTSTPRPPTSTPRPTATRQPTATPQPPGQGLQAQYFDTVNFSGTSIDRIDALINFDWGRTAPDPRMHEDSFSVQWSGYVVPKYSQWYILYMQSDDGVRMWLNNSVVMQSWRDQLTIESSTHPIYLEAGRRYPIKIQYYENGENATARLLWSSYSQPKAVIETSQLIPALLP